jgi:hypothetical protein
MVIFPFFLFCLTTLSFPFRSLVAVAKDLEEKEDTEAAEEEDDEDEDDGDDDDDDDDDGCGADEETGKNTKGDSELDLTRLSRYS